MQSRTNTEPVHEHEWHLDERLSAEFDAGSEELYTYEYCKGTLDPRGRPEDVVCDATRTTTFGVRHIEREDGTRIDSLDADRAAVLDAAATRVERTDVVERWWEPYGGIDVDEKMVHVYADGEDWYVVFQFESRESGEAGR